MPDPNDDDDQFGLLFFENNPIAADSQPEAGFF
jgi:hypothetical protein